MPGSQCPQRTIATYKAWVERLSQRKYAEELVVVAAAMEFGIRIVCVPFILLQAPQPWSVSTYPNADTMAESACTILLGKNDVHYMWLDQVP